MRWETQNNRFIENIHVCVCVLAHANYITYKYIYLYSYAFINIAPSEYFKEKWVVETSVLRNISI